MLYDLKQYQEASSLLEKYITIDATNEHLYQAHLLLASCFQEGFRDFPAYIYHFEKVLSLRPDLAEELKLHRNLFTAYFHNSQFDHAAVHLYHAITNEKEPVPRDHRLWLARYYFNQIKANPYLIEPLENANEREMALRGILIYKQVLSFPLTEPTLFLENEVLRLSHLLGWTGQRNEQMTLIRSLIKQQEEHPNWPWSTCPLAQFSLAYAEFSAGQEEGSFKTFLSLAKSKVADPYVSRASQLFSARLAFDKISQQDKKIENPEVQVILNTLKNLQICKVLAEEPIHLEAAIDYAFFRASLESSDKREAQLLFLFRRIKEDWMSQDDVCSKDYHASRTQFPEKDLLFQAYLMFIDAQSADLEAKQAFKEGNQVEARRKSEMAKGVYQTLMQRKLPLSSYLLSIVESNLENF